MYSLYLSLSPSLSPQLFGDLHLSFHYSETPHTSNFSLFNKPVILHYTMIAFFFSLFGLQ